MGSDHRKLAASVISPVVNSPLDEIAVEESGLIDRLTGLANRRSLIMHLEALIEAAGPDTRPALILLDLDRFKHVNDSLGPVVCDRVLQKVTQRLQKMTPEAHLIARVSGDGFAVLLADEQLATGVATRLLEFVSRPYAVGGHQVTLGASIGTAIAGQNGDDAIGLLHAADLAMHQAETDGRNRVKEFEASMPLRALMRHSLESDLRSSVAVGHVELRRALVSEQFEVHYQPQLNLETGDLAGFEALMRWRHPERGLVGPDRFIPVAEEIGLIDLLGDWVLRTACRDAMTWRVGPGQRLPRVAVNVSPFQMRDGAGLIAGIRKALAESGLPPERLEIELTESAMAADIVGPLTEIRDLGVELSLDDFGTGYSSLGRLRTLPFTKLKIDRSFTTDLTGDSAGDDRASGEWMIRAIASLGAGLGLTTIIEGIETEAQADAARRAGCTEMQGYLVSAPVAAAAVNQLIDRIDQRFGMRGKDTRYGS
jgi:diguanylate cyclase (GGDEF)-like protein